MKYHLRDILGTVQLNAMGQEYSITGFEAALGVAYTVSADTSMTIYVCRGSSGTELPSFTEIACVRACK